MAFKQFNQFKPNINKKLDVQVTIEMDWVTAKDTNLTSISVWAFTAWRRELETAEADLRICSFQPSVSLG